MPTQTQGPVELPKAMDWLHVSATPQPSIICQVAVMTGQFVTTLTRFVTMPLVQQVFVQPGGPREKLVVPHGRN